MPESHQITRRQHHLGAALALVFVSGAASAETPRDSYWGELSYFYPEITSTARLDLTGTDRTGTVIKLEDDLNLDDRKGTPYLAVGMRLGQAWRLEFEYYQLTRSASKIIESQIDWGDTSFLADTQVDSKFDTFVYRVTGGYSFLKTESAEAGVSLGLHITDFKTRLSGAGSVVTPSGLRQAAMGSKGFRPSGSSGGSMEREARSTLVPLPTLGLYGTYGFAEQWQLRGRIDYLSLKYQEYDGSLLNTMASVDWRFAKNWGAGVGYRYVDYKLKIDESKFHGKINYKFSGPTLFLSAAF